MRKIIVDAKNNNKTLSSFLLANFNGLNINLFHKTLRKKDIRVNNVRVTENVTLHTNDEVSIYLIDEYLFKAPTSASTYTLDIVFEDKNILIINKPKEISVTDNKLDEISLEEIVSKQYDFCKPCHRLDRNTSGLLIFAKNQAALDILLQKFKNKEINKTYSCDVVGFLKQKQATLTAYLFKDTKKSQVYISDTPKKNYLEIITKYKVISENKEENYSTLEVELITGKTHQIRAHMAHIGHPIIGDSKYGINDINKKFKERYQRLSSKKIVFNFKTDSGILNYLSGKTIELK